MRVEAPILAAGLLLGAAAGCGPETETRAPGAAVIHQATPVRSPGAELKVVSWNIKGSSSARSDQHLGDIAEIVEREGAEVLLLQEVHRNTKASGGIDQFVLLAESLDMNGCFGESLAVGQGSYGNAILTSGAVESGEVFPLPGGGEPRTVLQCVIRWGELEVPAMTTHLTAWDRFNRRTRELQVNAIESIVGELASAHAVIGGDFNASLTSSEMRSLRAYPALEAVFTDYVVTHAGTGRHYDHLLVGNGWQVESARIAREGPSDHWPLVASLSLRGSGIE